ncbi:MAG: hypothetical protein HY782_06050 [Chloroflexi bacterium]|nr:hypothetical protein [Chloroflexota bacterium]
MITRIIEVVESAAQIGDDGLFVATRREDENVGPSACGVWRRGRQLPGRQEDGRSETNPPEGKDYEYDDDGESGKRGQELDNERTRNWHLSVSLRRGSSDRMMPSLKTRRLGVDGLVLKILTYARCRGVTILVTIP